MEDKLRELAAQLPEAGWDDIYEACAHNAREPITANDLKESGLLADLTNLLRKRAFRAKALRAVTVIAENRVFNVEAMEHLKDAGLIPIVNETMTPEAIEEDEQELLSRLIRAYAEKLFELPEPKIVLHLLATGNGEVQENIANAITRLRDNVYFDKAHLLPELIDIMRGCECVEAQLAIIRSASLTRGESAIEKGTIDLLTLAIEEYTDTRVVKEAVKFFQNAVFATDNVRIFIAENCTVGLAKCLTHNSSDIRWRTCDTLRNVCMSGPAALRCKIGVAQSGAMPLLTSLIEDDEDLVKLHASYALWNTSSCPAGANVMVNEDLFPRILKIYEALTFERLIDGDSLKCKLVGVLCCVGFHCGERECEFLRQEGLQNYLHPLVKSTNPVHQPVNAALGLARLIGHIENHPLLDADTDFFKMFIECFGTARRGYAYQGAMFTEELLMPSIARLSVSDSNKQLLLDTGCFDVACKEFSISKNDTIIEGLASLLANMSFKYDLEKDVKPDCMAMLQVIKAEAKSKKARDTAEVALFNQEKRRAESTDSAKSPKKHTAQSTAASKAKSRTVLISCPAAFTQDLKPLLDTLVTMNVKCLLQGHGPLQNATLGTMASHVEDASVVIACLCKEYKESSECRSMGEYAASLHKPVIALSIAEGYAADGWVRKLVAGALAQLEMDVRLMEGETMGGKISTAIAAQIKTEVQKALGEAVPSSQATTTTTSTVTATHLPTPPTTSKISAMAYPNQQLSGPLGVASAQQRANWVLAEFTKQIAAFEETFLSSTLARLSDFEKKMDTFSDKVNSMAS